MTGLTLGQLWTDSEIPSVNLPSLIRRWQVLIFIFVVNKAMVGRWFDVLEKATPILPCPEKISLRSHAKMVTSDNKEPISL